MDRMRQIKVIEPVLLLLSFTDNSDADSGEPVVEFTLPDNLADREAVSDEQLDELEAQAVAAFDAIREGEVGPDELHALNDLTAAIESIRTERQAREQADAEAAAQVDELAARVHGTATDADEASDQSGDEEDGDEGEPPDQPDVETQEGERPGEGEEDSNATAAAESDEQTESVAAAGSPVRPVQRRVRVPARAISRHAPSPQMPVGAGAAAVSITAAADLRGRSPGSPMTPDEVAEAMWERCRRLPDGAEAPVATIERSFEHTLTASMSAEQQEAMLDAAVAASVARVEEGMTRLIEADNPRAEWNALVAAGGWCAPSQPLYDLFSIEGVDGLVDLPTVGVQRGGIEFVQDGGPSIADVWDSEGIFLWTEQNDIDAHTTGLPDPTKPCAVITCPTWVEERLEMHGICLTHGNLANAAFPEGTRRYVDLLVAANTHIINSRILADIAAQSTDVTIAASFGAQSAILGALNLQAEDYRDKFRMADNAVLDAVFPRWVRGLVRADLARRNGVDLRRVTNAEIAADFAAIGVRPQFVYDWQPLQTGAAGADGFREAWPTTVRFFLFATGTFVRGNGPTLDLNVTRDSTLNPTNDYSAAFTEEAILLAKRGHESREVIVTVEPDGATGRQVAEAEEILTVTA